MTRTWKDEYERRCRRVLGVTDDTQRVWIRIGPGWVEDQSCEFPTIEVSVGRATSTFDDMGDLVRALDAVPDEPAP